MDTFPKIFASKLFNTVNKVFNLEICQYFMGVPDVLLTTAKADEILQKMVEKGFYSPIRSMADIT